MLRPRITPVLLVRDGGLVKTVQFENGKYVGDPLNAVRIFNEKEVDELMVLDIDATRLGKEPDYKLIQSLSGECRMPLCYGGGVSRSDQVERIVGLGVEKVALSSAAIADPILVSECARKVGSQSVVVVLDVKKARWRKKYEVYVVNASVKAPDSLTDTISRVVGAGAGELIINSIDNDGRMQGYDLELVDSVIATVSTPVTFVGGAGALDDISSLIQRVGVVGAAAGSLFVFKGRYRAVLINYPNRATKDQLIAESFSNNIDGGLV